MSANVPQYIIGKLGLTRDPLADLNQDLADEASNKEQAASATEDEESGPQASSTPKKKGSNEENDDQNCSCSGASSISENNAAKRSQFVEPSEHDFDTIKLVSNGASSRIFATACS